MINTFLLMVTLVANLFYGSDWSEFEINVYIKKIECFIMSFNDIKQMSISHVPGKYW